MSKYLLGHCYVWGTVLGTGDTAVMKTPSTSCLHSVCVSVCVCACVHTRVAEQESGGRQPGKCSPYLLLHNRLPLDSVTKKHSNHFSCSGISSLGGDAWGRLILASEDICWGTSCQGRRRLMGSGNQSPLLEGQ